MRSVLMQDYMFTTVESAPLPDGRALWVLDLKGKGQYVRSKH